MFQSIVDFLGSIFHYIHQYIEYGSNGCGLSYVLAIFTIYSSNKSFILPFNIKAAKSMQGMQEDSTRS